MAQVLMSAVAFWQADDAELALQLALQNALYWELQCCSTHARHAAEPNCEAALQFAPELEPALELEPAALDPEPDEPPPHAQNIEPAATRSSQLREASICD